MMVRLVLLCLLVWPAATAATPRCRPVVNEADTLLGAAAARQAFDVTGAGVTVGVLAGSFATAPGAPTTPTEDVRAGELPGPGNPCGQTISVTVLADAPAGTGTDEGRAMLHLIHDSAPAARLVFHATGTTEEQYAAAIRRLRFAARADVIVDDVMLWSEPLFVQDTPIAQAIRDVQADGAIYVTAAGNTTTIDDAGRSIGWYRATYRPTPCTVPLEVWNGRIPIDCHNFHTSGVSTTSRISVKAGGGFDLLLGWDEPRGSGVSDLDILLLDAATGRVLARSADTNGGGSGTQRPAEVVSYRNRTSSTQRVQIVIGRQSATAPPQLGYVLLNANGIRSTQFHADNSTDSYGATVFGHALLPDVVTVGAVRHDRPDRLAAFASVGSGKPDVLGISGVQTTFFGAPDGTVYRFHGTSAAAPQVAGAIALLIEAARRSDRVLRQQTVTTLLMTTAAPVPGSSAGRIQADRAIAQLATLPAARVYFPLTIRP